MVPVKPEKQADIFAKENIMYTSESNAFEAVEQGRQIGFCLFEMQKKCCKILSIATEDEDEMLADGLLRAVLHYAQKRGILSLWLLDIKLAKNYEWVNFTRTNEGLFCDIQDFFGNRCR